MPTPVLGVDIGGVIRQRECLELPEPKILIEGVIPAIRDLTLRQFGPDNVVIISRQQRALWDNTTSWLVSQGFFQQTGVRPDNVHYCLDRNEKAGIAGHLGVTHFVDNRLEVFQHMTSRVTNKFLFRPQKCELENPREVGYVSVVWSWKEAAERITQTFSRPRR